MGPLALGDIRDSGTFILFAYILFWPVVCLLLCIVLPNEKK